MNDAQRTQIDWVRANGQNMSLCKGPQTDHTLFTGQGHYMFACFKEQPKGIHAALSSEDFDNSIDRCLTFWLYLTNGSDIMLTIKQEPITEQNFTIIRPDSNNNYSTGWTYYQIDIPSIKIYNFQYITLVATLLSSSINTEKGLALDDIR